jgi:flagellin
VNIQRTGSTYVAGSRKTEQALKKTSNELQKIIERLATGSKINRASDDAAGLSVSEGLRTRIRGFKMASQNVENSISAVTIADGAGSGITAILQRQRELAIQSSNGTLNDRDRVALDTEYQALNREIDRIAGSAQFNRQSVTTGTELASGNAVIQAGPEAGDQIAMPEIDLRIVSIGVAGSSIASASSAQTALSSLDNALQSVNTQRSTLGSTVNRLESTINNLSVAAINTEAAESVLRDQDMALGLAELTKQQLLNEGAVKAFGRFKTLSYNHIMGLLS